MPTAESAMSQRFFTGPSSRSAQDRPPGSGPCGSCQLHGAGGAMPAGPWAQKCRIGESQPIHPPG